MTTAADGAVPMTRCAACGTDVPAAAFCGTCGAQLTTLRGDGRGLMRSGAYAAAPGEHLLRLSVASSLFPHLPHRSRMPFRVGLAILLIGVVALAFLRWQAPMIAIGSLGFPLLFLLYLHESDVDDDLPVGSLALTTAMGAVLGVGWAWFTGNIVAHSYDVALSDGTSGAHSLLEGLIIPAGTAICMLAPAMVMRLFRPATRESLDGFVIGALGAIGFTAAATLTRLAPQFATGVVAQDQPVDDLLTEAAIQGVALPLSAAAMGGLVGAALWFTRPADARHTRRLPIILLISSVLLVIAVHTALGLSETVPISNGVHVGAHLVVAVIALLALRFGLQAVLLYEAHDEIDTDARVLCPHCDHVVPDMAFCPNCGVATRAASRTARSARRAQPDGAVTTTRPGYAVPAGSYAVQPMRHTSHRRLLLSLGTGVLVAAAVAVGLSILTTPVVPRYVCPPDCGTPPIGKPVESNPRFTSSDGRFSVQYPGEGSAYKATLDPDGVALEFTGGDTGTLDLFGLPAEDRTPKQIAEHLIHEWYPDATVDYEIPNAMVGYRPGYGVVADDYPQGASGSFTRLRMVVMVAVKNDYALVAAATGPYHEFAPDFGSGHPSGANLQLALDMGKYVNSFSWRDDSPH